MLNAIAVLTFRTLTVKIEIWLVFEVFILRTSNIGSEGMLLTEGMLLMEGMGFMTSHLKESKQKRESRVHKNVRS